jgi:arylsulfatase A
VGQIVGQLGKSGILDNTLVLFTSDNGTHRDITSKMKDGRSIKGGKSLMTDAGTHVPFVAYWKGVTPKGVVKDDLVDFSDFLPTVVEAAGGSLPKDRTIDGVSFLPQLKGQVGTPREWVFCHYKMKDTNKSREYIRDKRYKLYGEGRFHAVKNDVGERNPLKALPPDAAAAKKKLAAALRKLQAG